MSIQKTQNARDHTALLKNSIREPLANHRLFRSDDLDCAREQVAQKYCAHRLDLEGLGTPLDVVHNHFAADDMSFNYMRYGGKVEIEPGELEKFYLIQIPLSGTAEITNGNQMVESTTEFATILNPDLKTKMVWHADCEMLLLQIDARRMKHEAQTYLGRHLTAPIRFEPAIRMKSSQLKIWRQKIRDMFRAAEQGENPIGKSEMIHELLEALPSNIQCFFDAAPHNVASAQISRAMDFIKANFKEELTLEDISKAAGASPRALQYGFKSQFSVTPMQMLRLERLRWARHILMAATPNQTITRLAGELGFQHLGRFSQDYREAFGETPNQTLFKSKRQL
ncbi:AraC family transcriptional regulator [Maritalea sp.]|uniref:AraC family transcriptional regulator n=1 Tax=Maritalea sp. TaxID=2003361 RepID=UPI003EF3B029